MVAPPPRAVQPKLPVTADDPLIGLVLGIFAEDKFQMIFNAVDGAAWEEMAKTSVPSPACITLKMEARGYRRKIDYDFEDPKIKLRNSVSNALVMATAECFREKKFVLKPPVQKEEDLTGGGRAGLSR